MPACFRVSTMLCLAGCLFARPALADEPLKLSGSVRFRYEAIAGQPRVGFNDSDDLVNLRTTLRAEYDARPVTLVAEVYDSRVWAENAGTPVSTGEVNALELVQAYVAVDAGAAFGPGSRLKVEAGRMMLNIGSRRLIAADEYRNTTNSYTGVLADWSIAGGAHGTLLYVLPQLRLPADLPSLRQAKVRWDRESFEQVLWGGLAATPLAPKSRHILEAGFVHFGERDAPGRPTRDRSLDTVSARAYAEPKPGKLDYEVEAIYQWGRTATSLALAAPRVPVRASFLHARVGYSFSGALHARMALEFDGASGDGRNPRYGRFDPLFGMRRADLGPAGLYNAFGRSNHLSPGIRLEVAPSKRLDAFTTWRPLWLASRFDSFSTTGVRDATGRSGSFAGHQFDARLRYWLRPKHLRFEANGVLLLKGRFLREAPNAPRSGDTRYVSLNMTALF